MMTLHFWSPFTRWLERWFIIFIYSNLAANGGACIKAACTGAWLWFQCLCLVRLYPWLLFLSQRVQLHQVTIPLRLCNLEGQGSLQLGSGQMTSCSFTSVSPKWTGSSVLRQKGHKWLNTRLHPWKQKIDSWARQRPHGRLVNQCAEPSYTPSLERLCISTSFLICKMDTGPFGKGICLLTYRMDLQKD